MNSFRWTVTSLIFFPRKIYMPYNEKETSVPETVMSEANRVEVIRPELHQ